MKLKFGFWPRRCELRVSDIFIAPLAEFDSVVEGIAASGRVADNWFYPPLVRQYTSGVGSENQPLVADSAYGLPPTHRIDLPSSDGAEQRGNFLIATAGMLDGLRLIQQGWSHFYRCAVKLQTIGDVFCTSHEIEVVVAAALQFWDAADAEARHLIFGAIHWCMFADSYVHEFERFGAHYTVFDTCFRLHCHQAGKRITVPHAKRPSFLASQYDMPVPSWAVVATDGSCELSKLRNEFIHEARYGGEPIGFAHPEFNPSIDLQLLGFNMRLIVAMLGVDCTYIKSPVDTRSMHDIGLPR